MNKESAFLVTSDCQVVKVEVVVSELGDRGYIPERRHIADLGKDLFFDKERAFARALQQAQLRYVEAAKIFARTLAAYQKNRLDGLTS